MDVQSLYPNIDHIGGIDTYKTHLDKKDNIAFPTSWLTKLIQLILKSNTMIFNGYYFQWTAMGTPLAVSYANIFVSMFELNMLLEYQNKCKPTS